MTGTSSLCAVRRPVPAGACLPAIVTAIATAIMASVLAAIVSASGAAALDAASPPLPGVPSAGAPASGSATGTTKPARSTPANSTPANSTPANSIRAPSVPVKSPGAGGPNASAGSRLLRMLAGEAPGQPPPAGAPERSKTAAASTPISTAPFSGAPNPAGAASVIEGCPRALLTRLLAGAARREDALSALAIEHETLKLCRERQTIVTGIFETEARLRALRAPAEPAAIAGVRSPGPTARTVRTVPAVPTRPVLPQLSPPPAGTAPKPARPAPPRYGWFSIVGMAGALRAGVTDGRRVWFVREGDPLPGDVRVGRIAARPPGVEIEGVHIEGGDESSDGRRAGDRNAGALPYRARPGGGS